MIGTTAHDLPRRCLAAILCCLALAAATHAQPPAPDADAPAAASPRAEHGVYLIPHRQRGVFAETERAALFDILLVGPQPAVRGRVLIRPVGAPAAVSASATKPTPLCTLEVPAVAVGSVDARGFTLDMAALTPGDYEVWVESGGQRSAPRRFRVVPWRQGGGFFVLTVAGAAPWPTSERGLALLQQAGVEMVATARGRGLLDAPLPAPPRNALARDAEDRIVPVEAVARPAPAETLLEKLLSRRLRLVDAVTPPADADPGPRGQADAVRAAAQRGAEFPSFWGVSLPARGAPARPPAAEAITPQELAWYLDRRASTDPADRAKALALRERAVARFRAQDPGGAATRNRLAAAAIQQARPGTACTAIANAAHPFDEPLASAFHELSAAAYESASEFGDWPMSAAWTTDLTLAEAPGRPVWLTACGGASPEGQQKALMQAFARGLAGGGVPMPETESPDELARRGKGMNLLSQYGAIATHATPDRRVLLLSTDARKIFGVHDLFDLHAVYCHLTRLGFSPGLVSESTLLKDGVPAAAAALVLVQERDPLPQGALSAINAFAQRGGRVIQIGPGADAIPSALRIERPVKNIWDFDGLAPASHEALWREFRAWRPLLEDVMARAGVSPRATTDPRRAFALVSEAAGVRYVAVIADRDGRNSDEFEPIADVPVSIEGEGWAVRDLARQVDLPTRSIAGRTVFSVQLLTEPTTLVAAFRSPPASLRVSVTQQVAAGGSAVFSCTVLDKSGASIGAAPVRFVLTDSAGVERGQWFRAACERVCSRVPDLEPAGARMLTIQELLTGVTADVPLAVTAGPASAAVATPLDTSYVVNPDRVLAALRAPGEKAVVIDAGRAELRPVAERLVQGLRDAKIDARLEVEPREEAASRPRSDDDEPSAPAETRPRREPEGDVIVFRGGRIVEEMAAASPWMGSPNIPGRGQGRLVAAAAPHAAGRDAIALIANDAEGFAAAAERLARLASAGAPPPPAPTAAPVTQTLSPACRMSDVARPYVNFTPMRRVTRVLVDPAGRIAVSLRVRPGLLAFVSPDGRRLGTYEVPAMSEEGAAARLTIDSLGRVWGLSSRERGTRLLRAIAPDGRCDTALLAWPALAEGMEGVEGGFAAAPDGRRVALARPGALVLGGLAENEWVRYEDVPQAQRRHEVLYPRTPVSCTFSPDSSVVLVSWDSRAPLGPMGTPLSTTTAGEATLIDAATGRVIWRLRNPQESGGRYSVATGFAAVGARGRLTAMLDHQGVARMVDAAGRIVVEKLIAPPIAGQPRSAGPARGVGVDLSPDGALAAFATTHSLSLATGNKIETHRFEGLASVSVLPSGDAVAIGTATGEVLVIPPNGPARWRVRAGDGPAVVRALPGGGVAAGLGDGTLVLFDAFGRETSRQSLMPPEHDPAREVTLPTQPLNPGVAADNPDPGTLAVARAMLDARLVDAWKPAGAGVSFAGLAFHPLSDAIEFAAAPGQNGRFLHLVYRRPDDNRALRVVARDGAAAETFHLDLPTPTYRVIDLPLRGAAVRVESDGPVEIAECSLWSFQWPGPNLAPPRAGEAAGSRVVKTWWPSVDPERSGGAFLPPRVDPARLVNGAWFEGGALPPFAEKAPLPAVHGGSVTIEFPAAAPVRLVATYDRSTVQSRLSRAICVFTDFSPERGPGDGKVLAGRIDNDQFWRLIPLPENTSLRQLGVQVFTRGDQPCGLSEVEAYR